jgi:uncharacterized heparinase superfamily protein
MLSHDGYRQAFGLTYLRRLALSGDGGSLSGEESLRAISTTDKERFEDAQAAAGSGGVPFQVRFHLHPDVEAAIDADGRTVTIALPSGETWLFRAGHGLRPTLEPSVHLEPGRPHPQPARQVVLSDRVVKYAATIEWSLNRATGAEAPEARRDRDRKDQA